MDHISILTQKTQLEKLQLIFQQIFTKELLQV